MNMTSWEQRIREAKGRTDRISPTFCAAKWLQVTLHLQTGQNHSCCLTETHPIPLRGLADNPALLHNTPYKKKMRQMMLDGERPAECRCCWEEEDASPGLFSERHIKSGDPWALPFIDGLAKVSWEEDAAPTYVEVSFGLECNLRCMYCLPHVSSGVLAEYREQGPFPVTYPVEKDALVRAHKIPADLRPLPPDNDYVRAFWHWFPAILGRLKVFRITGGEPLLNPNTFKVLDFLEEHPGPELELCVNSNLCVEAATYDRFVRQCRRLIDGGKVARIVLFTSLEAHGVQSDYIRAGSDYNLIMANCRRWLEEIPARTKLVFMSTFNILSFTSFGKFARDVLELKKRYSRGERIVILDVAMLNDPYYLRPVLATPELGAQFAAALAFIRAHRVEGGGDPGFFPYEINKLERIEEALEKPFFADQGLYLSRRDFAAFIYEYDRRRILDFDAAFPDMGAFMKVCRSGNNAIKAKLQFPAAARLLRRLARI